MTKIKYTMRCWCGNDVPCDGENHDRLIDLRLKWLEDSRTLQVVTTLILTFIMMMHILI